MRIRSLLAAVVLAALPTSAGAQAVPQSHETSSQVPALADMHEVVMPLWHEAWPAKDTKQMAGFLPGIEKHVAAIASAKLPGILRDKQEEWNAGVKRLQATAADYRAAVQRKDDEALMKAAEALHMEYEKLVRVVRPATPEIDAVHQAVYVLYHYDLEKLSLPSVREHVQTLQARTEALERAALPARHSARKDAYEQARKRFSQAVAALVAAAAGSDQSKIKAGIEEVHAGYEALDAVFQQG